VSMPHVRFGIPAGHSFLSFVFLDWKRAGRRRWRRVVKSRGPAGPPAGRGTDDGAPGKAGSKPVASDLASIR
jgi:hypothetical protein